MHVPVFFTLVSVESALKMSFTSSCDDVGMSDIYKLNSVGESNLSSETHISCLF